MGKIIKSVSTYNETTQTWNSPTPIGMDADKVIYDNSSLEDFSQDAEDHEDTSVTSEDGVHGLRFYMGELSYWDGTKWAPVMSDDSEVLLDDVTGASATISQQTATLTWTDPTDKVVEGTTVAEWAGTVVVRKIGSAPESTSDGTIILTETVRNQYSVNGYVDSNLTYGTVYYYRFFPYKVSGAIRQYTKGSSVSVTPIRGSISDIPSFKSNLTYSGNIQTVTDVTYWNDFDSDKLSIGGVVSGTNAGNYTAEFTPRLGYQWSDGGTTAKQASWTIEPQKVTIPSITDTSLTFNNTVQGPTITPKDATLINFINDEATHAGDYELEMALVDAINYMWSDGTITNRTKNWNIAAKSVAIPSLTGTFTYDGTEKTVTIDSYDATDISQSGVTAATNAGTYTVVFHLLNDTGYTDRVWANQAGAANDQSKTWTISPQVVTAPTITDLSLTFNNTTQGPTITPKDTTLVNFTDDSAIHAGSYTLRANLKDTNNYIWSTGNASEISQVWSIAAKQVTLPSVTGNYVYDTTEQSVVIDSYDTSDISQSGTVAATNAGTYTVTFHLLNDVGYTDRVWADQTSSSADRNRTWTISSKPVNVPTMGSNLTYNGNSQNAPIGTYSASEITVSGDTSATSAGIYIVELNLIDTVNYVWNDTTGGIGKRELSWTINKAAGYVTLSKTYVELTASNPTNTVTVNSNSGTVSVTSNNVSVATASLTNGIITITGIANGTTAIIVNVAASNNYLATSARIDVDVSLALKVVTFADGTDKEIKAMLDAYYNDEITWAEMGWAIGDTRKIHLNSMQAPNPDSSDTWAAQDITVVIVAHDHTDLATSINGHTKACITVQTREVLNNNTYSYDEDGHIYINGNRSYDMSWTKWSNLYMRTYINSTVLSAIPAGDFKSAIKPSKHYRHTTYNGSTAEQVTDTLFLPSYPEIFGPGSYNSYVPTSPTEGTQFSYYTTSSNRIKYGNNNGAPNGTKQYWWEGSAHSLYHTNYGYYWCCVDPYGTADYEFGNRAQGLAPAFAM